MRFYRIWLCPVLLLSWAKWRSGVLDNIENCFIVQIFNLLLHYLHIIMLIILIYKKLDLKLIKMSLNSYKSTAHIKSFLNFNYFLFNTIVINFYWGGTWREVSSCTSSPPQWEYLGYSRWFTGNEIQVSLWTSLHTFCKGQMYLYLVYFLFHKIYFYLSASLF